MAAKYDVLQALRLITLQNVEDEASDSDGTSDEEDVPDKIEPISGDLEPAEVDSELLNIPEFVSYCVIFRETTTIFVYMKNQM